MTPAQCRAARALLDITQSDLAEAAALGLSTVVDFEKQRRQVSDEAVRSIPNALERAGIAFSSAGDAGEGVMMPSNARPHAFLRPHCELHSPRRPIGPGTGCRDSADRVCRLGYFEPCLR